MVNNKMEKIRKEVILLYLIWGTIPSFDWRDWGEARNDLLGISAMAAKTPAATFRIQARRVTYDASDLWSEKIGFGLCNYKVLVLIFFLSPS
jgi:hypothetical protein